MLFLIYWFGLFLTFSLANSQILGKFIDNLACRRTTSNGFYGECLPRRCCSSGSLIRNLCLTSTDVCCYGEDICSLEHNRRLPTSIQSHPIRGINDYCDRYVVTRADWQAVPSTKRPYRMPVRVDQVIIHHTGSDDDQCWSLEQCRHRLRQMQSYYQREKQFPDIPWNFLISNNGDIYEGVGWDSQGYHTEHWNDRSIGIAFIGDYDQEAPSTRALRALNHLLDCGVEQFVLDRYYRIQGHRDMRPTGCPGDYLYDALRQFKSTRNTISADDGLSSNDLEFIEDEFLQRSDLNRTENKSENNLFSDTREKIKLL